MYFLILATLVVSSLYDNDLFLVFLAQTNVTESALQKNCILRERAGLRGNNYSDCNKNSHPSRWYILYSTFSCLLSTSLQQVLLLTTSLILLLILMPTGYRWWVILSLIASQSIREVSDYYFDLRIVQIAKIYLSHIRLSYLVSLNFLKD